MKPILLFLCFFYLGQLCATGQFEFTSDARSAYDLATQLRLDEARQKVNQLKISEPNNLSAYYIENYIDFFTIFINEDKKEFQRLEKAKDDRLEKIKSGNKESPYYLFMQAEIKLQWALVRLKFEEYVTALFEIKSAYKLLEKNQKRFPDFLANQKSLAIMHAMIGTVPDNYRWGVKLLSGMDGTIEQGQRELEEVIAYGKTNDFIFEQEAVVLYAFLMLHLNNKSAAAWSIISNSKLNHKESPLAAFALANLAMRTGRNAEAITILLQRPEHPKYHKFHYLDFMLGVAKLRRLDEDASSYLKRFVQNFDGQNYIKEAYQKLAWAELLKDNSTGYEQYMKDCKQHGHAFVESDKNALKEAKEKLLPDAILLKARLLFDGGYYQRAYDLLKNKTYTDFSDLKSQLEFNYRLGRIAHQLKLKKEAINYYQITIEKGSNLSYYFACNSALQLGKLYESYREYDLAKSFFKKCLNIYPDEYQSGLHQQAKAGLNRLKKL
ncbi:MAG: tol-pal system YbgF family protein [Saprospiraceae bacterium]